MHNQFSGEDGKPCGQAILEQYGMDEVDSALLTFWEGFSPYLTMQSPRTTCHHFPKGPRRTKNTMG